MGQRKRRVFTDEQKIEAVRLVRAAGNLSKVARDIDVSPGLLRRWVELFDPERPAGGQGTLSAEERSELTRLRRQVHVLEMERDFAKKSRGLLRKGSEAYALIEAEKANYPIAMMCRVLKVARSGFYAWLRRPLSKRVIDDAAISNDVAEIHLNSRGTYGSLRVHAALKRRGSRISRKRVARLMKKQSLSGKIRRKYRATTDSDHQLAVAESRLLRKFSPDAPNKAWDSDITYIATRAGWLYLAVVIDLFSRRVIGWSMKERMDADLVLAALEMATGMRDTGPGLLDHSDRGSQYASRAFSLALSFRGLEPSMSRRANCWDNAVVESFFGTLKQELVHHERWKTRDEARLAIHEYIEVFYNRVRLHSTLGYLSPVDFEQSVA